MYQYQVTLATTAARTAHSLRNRNPELALILRWIGSQLPDVADPIIARIWWNCLVRITSWIQFIRFFPDGGHNPRSPTSARQTLVTDIVKYTEHMECASTFI